VRVIAGSARGRILRGPPRAARGERPAIRPTSDLIRGVIFDMLDALGADYTRVLDLYAGTGALGIEALSRDDDATADFVDSDGTAAALIRANLERTGFARRARVHRMPVEAATSSLQGPYTLVLADPPYYDEAALAGGVAGAFGAVQAIADAGLIDEDSVVVVEHHRRVAPADTVGDLPLYRTRRHGDTVVSIYART
jgi:16S rRNA (guanine966-N2)-methyltransferase